MDLFRTRRFNLERSGLKQTLSAFDLIFLGIGAIIGAGIFVLTGIAAATKAGPAIVLSYTLAGLASAFAALCYAEFAASVGGAGSAYTYAYAALGEFIAWIIGWDLILEYSLGICAVAIGWSGYVNDILLSLNLHLPAKYIKSTIEGGFFDILAFIIVLFLTSVVALGVRLSANLNLAIVFIKLIAIAIFIIVAIPEVKSQYWTPFLPFGFSGIASGAALVFFAFIGFDAVSTAAEETINPQRNLPIGILGSLFVCTIIYIVVSLLLTGIAPYSTLNVKSPVADTILHLGHKVAAGFIAAGAVAGLTSVMLIFIFGMTRIFFAMSRDGLLPSYFSSINPKTHTPVRAILCAGIIIAFIAGLSPIADIAELVNIGTLAAFIIVCISVIFLRRSNPELKRPFKTPFSPIVPILGVISCGYLMISLPWVTWLRFVIWMILGLIVFFTYSYKNSNLNES